MSSNHYQVISATLFIIAFIILVINKTETNDVPDITIKYSEFFFLLSTLYAVRWLATNHYQRGCFYLVFTLADMFIAYLHFYEHSLLYT